MQLIIQLLLSLQKFPPLPPQIVVRPIKTVCFFGFGLVGEKKKKIENNVLIGKRLNLVLVEKYDYFPQFALCGT